MFRWAALLVAMAWAVTPTMACLMPGVEMTAAERECCQQMAAMCGGAHRMPMTHSCCQAGEPRQAPLATKVKTSTGVSFAIADRLPASLATAPSASSTFAPATDSPPESPPGCSPVLRI